MYVHTNTHSLKHTHSIIAIEITQKLVVVPSLIPLSRYTGTFKHAYKYTYMQMLMLVVLMTMVRAGKIMMGLAVVPKSYYPEHTHIHTHMHDIHTNIHTNVSAYIHILLTLHYTSSHFITFHHITLHYITLHYITYKHAYKYTYLHTKVRMYVWIQMLTSRCRTHRRPCRKHMSGDCFFRDIALSPLLPIVDHLCAAWVHIGIRTHMLIHGEDNIFVMCIDADHDSKDDDDDEPGYFMVHMTIKTRQGLAEVQISIDMAMMLRVGIFRWKEKHDTIRQQIPTCTHAYVWMFGTAMCRYICFHKYK